MMLKTTAIFHCPSLQGPSFDLPCGEFLLIKKNPIGGGQQAPAHCGRPAHLIVISQTMFAPQIRLG